MRFEIIIELNGYRYSLDNFQDESIEISYNIADINDISSRNSTYTKTVRVPETSLNRQIFSDIADLSVSSSFNPNKKTKCWVFVDSILVLEGYLQLRDVIDNIDLGSKEYELVIFAENDNFIKELGDLELNDLDFSELSHTYSADNIVNSWTQSWNHGYFYPLIDYGFDWDYTDISGNKLGLNDVQVRDMYPSTNVKYTLDKIFSDAGYSYQSDFLNSDVFKDLYIPFNKDYIKRDLNTLDDRFSIGITTPVTYTGTPSTVHYGSPGVPQYEVGLYRVPFNIETSPYGDPDGFYNTSTFEYVADNTGTSQRFVCNFDISFLYRGVNDYSFIDSTTNEPTTYICFKRSRNPLTGVTVSGGVVMPVNGSTTPIPFTIEAIPSLQLLGQIPVAATASSRVTGQISTDMLDGSQNNLKQLYSGEKVWVEVLYSCDGNVVFALQTNLDKSVITFNNGNEFFNVLNDRIIENEYIDYNLVTPKNIKQVDFFTSLIKMFNLYVEPSKEYDKTLVIEPRDKFYESGDVVDWTYKLDISQPLNIKILGETQNKKTIFKYRDDSDYYNTDYKNFKVGKSYGQYDYEIDNDFVTSEKSVELIFSPTPLVQVPTSKKIVIPKIGKVNNNLFSSTEHNVRILTKFRSNGSDFNYTNVSSYSSSNEWNGYTKLTGAHNLSEGDCIRLNISSVYNVKPIFKVVKVIDASNVIINLLYSDFIGSSSGTAYIVNGLLPTEDGEELWAFNTYRYRAYPYLGHFDNPFSPSYDLNFGQTVGLYYPEVAVTNDNLFSVYWENQMIEISDLDSRIISGEFYLTPDDISSFKFNNKVFIGNQYYKVNKITYSPTSNGLSKVELIKTLVITSTREFVRNVTTSSISTIAAGVPGGTLPPIKGPDPSIGVVIGGPRNTVRNTKTLVVGADNITNGQGISVIGSSNTVSSGGNFIKGDFNNIDHSSPDNFLVGKENTIKSGVSNSVIFGSNLEITESDTFYIQGKLVNAPNYISAGRNEILSPFSDSIVNYISASRDEVRELGSESINNFITAGRIVVN